ncbi:hypothetical protein M406DRAFT_74743 [Cryphonectria parasitica EP155]|uniref:Ecp2 effector protein-like domain-containing protein n=1 Tax=Cryphonectria parasitica (strain ATCC 38755 / EP155) TaxID=660469 RepID=A0A9P4XV27_CRYP1|nr:uncharacterized protein M406DRAFT_74743 [Cryphonectria parasitica EP155]KAF3761814.1 hypothetical protein M406DRAFT_74743 [Cryphonectria parasitica EP155]
MDIFISLLLLLLLYFNLISSCTATQVRHVNQSEFLPKRTYSEHFKLIDSVRNCTDAVWSLEALNTTASVSVGDCHKVLQNVRHNHGYYEVWGFDNDDFAPITGFQSCVFAVAQTGPDGSAGPQGYAVVGNDDVVSVVVEAIGTSKDNITGAAGSFTCGTNQVVLSVIVYNGLNGYDGTPSAPSINLWGDIHYTTRETATAPTVTSVPTEIPTSTAGG